MRGLRPMIAPRPNRLLEGGLQHVDELVELERFRHEVRGSPFESVYRVLHGAVARHDDGDDAGVAFEGGLDEALTVQAWEA
jgi:hypothetical protein